MRTAYFSKKFQSLYYFVGRNVAESVYCANINVAKIKIKNSGIEQKLEKTKDN